MARNPLFAVARPPTVDTINVHDLRPMNIHCPFCDALHWKEERKKKFTFSISSLPNKIIIKSITLSDSAST